MDQDHAVLSAVQILGEEVHENASKTCGFDSEAVVIYYRK